MIFGGNTVNAVDVVAEPSGVVTVMSPVGADIGTTAMREVPDGATV